MPWWDILLDWEILQGGRWKVTKGSLVSAFDSVFKFQKLFWIDLWINSLYIRGQVFSMALGRKRFLKSVELLCFILIFALFLPPNIFFLIYCGHCSLFQKHRGNFYKKAELSTPRNILLIKTFSISMPLVAMVCSKSTTLINYFVL